MKNDKAREALISYISEKGFVYGPSPEIYGGISGFFDFGPLGKLLKNNVENSIRKLFTRFQFYEVECPMVVPKVVWEASGHLGGFSDPLVKCKKCASIFRADNLIQEQTQEDVENLIKMPWLIIEDENDVINDSVPSEVNSEEESLD